MVGLSPETQAAINRYREQATPRPVFITSLTPGAVIAAAAFFTLTQIAIAGAFWIIWILVARMG